MTADSCFEGANVTSMTQKRVTRVLTAAVLALLVSALGVSSQSSASRPAVRPGEILDLPACEGIETDGREIGSDPTRRMMRSMNAFGWGDSPEESRFTEQLGNVIIKIHRSQAPKGTTRFQLRYFVGNYDKSGEGPYHAKFFKNESIRVRIPNAKLDTYYFFQVAALRGDCILYTGGILLFGVGVGPYLGNVWCSVPYKKWLKVKDFAGRTTTRCPTAPKTRNEQEEGA